MNLNTNPYEAAPLRRHRMSLEGIMSLPTGMLILSENTRTQANDRLYHILRHFEAVTAKPKPQLQPSYNRPALVRLTYEYTQSDQSKDFFLSSFFESLALPLTGQVTDSDVDFSDPEVETDIGQSVNAYAEYLMNNFFLPLKASSNKTPQPSPITHSAVQRTQGSALPESITGTADRVSTLRGTCLVRDRHRCVISRKFDIMEGHKRYKTAQDGIVRDDDGLQIEAHDFRHLEVAHILPHSLTKASPDSLLSPARKVALDILNMFDMGVVHLIEGAEIDRPYNAITLSVDHHLQFGSFQVFFEPVSDQEPHTYSINAFDAFLNQTLDLPVTRTLYLTEDRSIDPPSPRLLAIHRAIGHILHLSGAGDYIDRFLRDAGEHGVRSDGSTELGRLVHLGLGGWAVGVDTRS